MPDSGADRPERLPRWRGVPTPLAQRLVPWLLLAAVALLFGTLVLAVWSWL